jgi:uncharacterized protein (TIGR03435 family)
MKRTIVGAGYFVLACSAALGQVSPAQSKFEVAAVNSVDPNSGVPGSNVMRGGPGTDDPARITFAGVTMKRLLMVAYHVDENQISGPGWLDSQRYAIVAKVPEGSTREQLLKMLQNLLAERFHLMLHHEMKDFPAYELVIAKGGSKLKQAVEAAPAAASPNPPPGRYYAASPEPGVSRLTFNSCTISDLANALGFPLGTMGGNMLTVAHIVDKTGLTGKYSFTLEFAGNTGPGGAFAPLTTDAPDKAPILFTALETQLGLKLNDKKTSLDVLVIDRIDKAPTAN